ncbi:50S ribosomal protein L18 [Listeria monocytogenes]|nr:50S ribosomal protein L18 [Listeria monocytogenes]GAT39621.1 50S ribosomal protein L18 [Listeria monocytogenes]GAT41865.1 50S ribosomal protein L18 [Listeria monocytogenes]
MFLFERNTFKRGRLSVPEILERTRACLFLRTLFLSILVITRLTSSLICLIKRHYLPVLPSLRRTCSPS